MPERLLMVRLPHSLTAARRSDEAAGGEAGVRLLTTLLTEMDGVEEATGEGGPNAWRCMH